MKLSFVLDSDREFTSFAERNLALYGYSVSVFKEANEMLSQLKKQPSLVIIGETSGYERNNLQYISQSRSSSPKSIIIHIVKTTGNLNDINSIKAGASEFIEKDGASFVRLRTALDDMQKGNQEKKSVIQSIKKAILG